MSENVTLSDLSNGAIPTATPVGMPKKLNTANVKEANINEAVIQSKPEEIVGTGNPMLDKAFEGVDKTINRLQSETNEIYREGEEKRIEQAIENDGDIDSIDETLSSNNTNTVVVHKFEDEVVPTSNPVVNPESVVVEEKPVTIEKTVEVSAPVAGTKKENIIMAADQSVYDEDEHLFDGIEDDDMKYLDEDEVSEEEKEDEADEKAKTEEIKETIRKEVNKSFNPISKKVNLNGFTIAKKPINAAKVINDIKSKAIECADGVLWHTKKAIRMSAWKPMEIQSIDPQRLRGSNYNKYIENKLKLIYEHIIDANKPKTFEAWAMITPNTVIDDYMFTAYKATFGLSNIVTFSCGDNKCSNVFMESVPINSMIKFDNDSIKEEYMKILHEGNTDSPADSEYNVTLYQASDEYVFALKIPSLYNTFIEPTLVNQDFNTKYEDRLLLLSYIDAIYKIDYSKNQLIPIDTKPVAGDKSLTYKRRIKTFDTILKSLTSDQLMALSVETDKYDGGKLDDDGELIKDISYVYPERRCPKCGRKIDEQVINPDNMLFTRHQLGLMKKI